MSTDAVYHYKLWCTTDSKWENVWSPLPPIQQVCPTNSSHAINTSSVVEIDRLEKNIVTISEEDVKTGGIWGCDSIDIEAKAHAIEILHNNLTVSCGHNFTIPSRRQQESAKIFQSSSLSENLTVKRRFF